MGAEIYAAILARILVSELGPGDRLTIDAMAREFGVSQTPVREALHRLDAEGIVVRHHLSGYRVRPKITREQFEDMVEVRLLLEPAASRRAAELMTPQELDTLKEIADEMRRLNDDRGSAIVPSYARFSQLDAQFHDGIAAGGRNSYIRDSLARLHPHVHLFRLSNAAQITAEAIDEHQEILDGIAARNPDAAAYAMRQHIDASARRFRRAFNGSDDPDG